MKYLFTLLAAIVIQLCSAQMVQPIVIMGYGGNTNLIDLINPGQEYTIGHQEDDPHFSSHGLALFTVSTDLAQYFLGQPNIDFEYHVSYHNAFGVNLGYVSPCLLYAENPMATGGQYTDPGTVYNGAAIRIYYKYYPGHFHKSYWEVQGVYKNLSYNNTGFDDEYEEGAIRNVYNMNEKETVLGIELIHGNRITREGDKFYADIFYGGGIHQRNRAYQIYSQTLMVSPGADYQNLVMATPGYYTSVLNLVTPVIGIKLGWNYLSHLSN